MRFVGVERRRIDGLMEFLQPFETFAESDEDLGVVINLVVLLRR